MRQGVFFALLSAGLSPGRNFSEFQKMRAEGVLAKFDIARLYGTLGAAVCCKMLCCVGTLGAFYIGDDGICARVFFYGLLSAGFFPGRNFAEFQKMRAEGVLAKFAIARLYGHLGSRGLLQNVVLCWHFKCILVRR